MDSLSKEARGKRREVPTGSQKLNFIN